MKSCVKCQFCNRQPIQVGPQANQVGMAYVCLNPDVADPVDGSPLPCHTVRSNENFCGIKGKHWKQKVEQPDTPSGDKKIIALV